MEIAQGNILCSYLYPKEAKMPCFSFYISLFSSTKSENRGWNGSCPGGRAGTSGKEAGDGDRIKW
jgi:hypothetical protein